MACTHSNTKGKINRATDLYFLAVSGSLLAKAGDTLENRKYSRRAISQIIEDRPVETSNTDMAEYWRPLSGFNHRADQDRLEGPKLPMSGESVLREQDSIPMIMRC